MRWASVAAGVLLGVLLLGAVRFAFAPLPEAVHHHANFAVFVDGERLDLSGERYMEDVAACAASGENLRPQDRIHLHNGDQDVVHVHHVGTTWGHLFANLGLGLGDDYLVLDDGRRFFGGEDERTLKFVIDGREVLDLANRPVASGDRVLVSVGLESVDEALSEQFPQVAANATEFNEISDPAGCAGAHAWTFADRLRHAFWAL